MTIGKAKAEERVDYFLEAKAGKGMPIECKFEVRRVPRAEYHDLDYRVMGHEFAIHNRLGTLHDERVYQNALQTVCSKDGIEIKTELPVTCRHDSFEKTYSIDALAENAVVYELKTVRSLDDKHRGQVMNYLLMIGLGTGKLVNFGSPSVESEYVTTAVGPDDRHRFELELSAWKPVGERSHLLEELLRGIVSDWGAFLSTDLYRDALVHFLGGEQAVLVQAPVYWDDATVGTSRFYRLEEGVAFEVTGHTVPKAFVAARSHLQRRLDSSDFAVIEWINFAGPTITLTTLHHNHSPV